MCGIAGAFNLSAAVGDHGLREIAGRMNAAIRRRGPDDAGIFTDPAAGLVLAQRRLSILDLSAAGHQPMPDESGRYVIDFNGEVYNFAQIRSELVSLGHTFRSHTDTEVILRGYMQWGADVLPRLRGMFAFVIYDRAGPELFCARDRFGIKPLICGTVPPLGETGAGEQSERYAREREGFFFASELKALTAGGLLAGRVRPGALLEYLAGGVVRQPGTVLEGACQLEPGHFLRVRAGADGRLIGEKKRWYDLGRETAMLRGELAQNDFHEQVGLTRARLEEAARYHLIADVPVGAFLSGGVDSSAVVALMARHCTGKIKAFTIGFEHPGEVVDELEAARQSAEFIGAEYHGVTLRDADMAAAFDGFIDTLDQPSMDGFNTFLVSRYAATGVKVALSGLGGDELFAGYPHFADIAATAGSRMPRWARALIGAAHGLRPNRLTRRLLYRGVGAGEAVEAFRAYAPVASVLRRLNQPLRERLRNEHRVLFSSALTPEEEARLSPLAGASAREIGGYLLSTLLRDADVCSMAHSLEVRPILLDHPLVEHAFALPDCAKLRDGQGKAAFSEAVRDLIPPACARRRKSGFELPFGRWAAGALRTRFAEALDSPAARFLYTPAQTASLRGALSDPLAARAAWRWLLLPLWLERAGLVLAY